MIVAHIFGRLLRGIVRGMLYRWFTSLLALGLIVGGFLILLSRGLVPGVPAIEGVWPTGGANSGSAWSDAREMSVENLRQVRNDRVDLTLREKGGNRRLTIVVGTAEALAIASDLSNRSAEGPVTYDLMRSIVRELGGSVNRVVVNNVTGTEFFAKVVLDAEGRQFEVDSRPSDAIALALRAKAPIFAEASVLDKAGSTN